MQVSKEGLNLIKAWEGLPDGDHSTEKFDPYMDPVGIWTIGYGHALINKYGRFLRGPEDRREANLKYPGGITQEEADSLLQEDVDKVADKLTAHNIMGTQAQIDALVSFAFNIGMGSQTDPRSGGLLNSTLLKMHRAGGPTIVGEMTTYVTYKLQAKSKTHAPIANIAEAFCAWANADKHWLKGLFRRRLCEFMIYRGDNLNKAIEVARGSGGH